MPTRSTCSATSPSTRRCAPAASAPSACAARRKDFFDRYGPRPAQILDELLEKYAEHGDAQFVLPDVLQGAADLRPRQRAGDRHRCSAAPKQLRDAVDELQKLLYAA